MKKSEKIIRKSGVRKGIPSLEKQIIVNTTLLEHIINNDLSHLWRWLLVVMGLIAGLYAKSFIIGG